MTLQLSARCLAEGIRTGELEAERVVGDHIRRVQQLNPGVNALVADRFEMAMAEARAVDGLTERDRTDRPLLGVPFSVKEMIAVEGMPATFGCGNRRHRRASADATVVGRLRAAGAIVLGVTNVPEWGMWYETYNHVYGRTNNPWDPGRTAGGSSGGEAALVGMGGSAFGVGTDIGGSIRMPAAFCGVYGHRPSGGLLPLTGIYPVYSDPTDSPIPGVPATRRAPSLAVGPLARAARDLPLLLQVMAGPDGVDPNAASMVLRDADTVSWSGRTVVLLPEPDIRLAAGAASSVAAAVQSAGAALSGLGANVVEAPAGLFRRAADAWFSALQAEGGPGFSELLGGGRQVSPIRETLRALAGRSEYSWPALFFALGEVLGKRGTRRMRSAQEETVRMAARFRDLTGDDGILIMPVHPRPAPRHNAPVLRPFDFLYTAVFNTLRAPATSVPYGFDEHGLPLAVQVAAPHGRDDLSLAAAITLEATLPAWRPAPATMATA
ncbi:MAG TPA: amidase [Longimicrobiales bacterium]|nr:amidase [Longimicrobiales bacterium]